MAKHARGALKPHLQRSLLANVKGQSASAAKPKKAKPAKVAQPRRKGGSERRGRGR